MMTAMRVAVRRSMTRAPRRATKARGGPLLAAALALAVIAALGTVPDLHPAAAAAPAEIHIKDFAFGPAVVTVTPGQKVTWVNDDSVPHTSTSADKRWDSGNILPGDSFATTFSKPGTYVYNCTVHPFMQAKIIVGQ